MIRTTSRSAWSAAVGLIATMAYVPLSCRRLSAGPVNRVADMAAATAMRPAAGRLASPFSHVARRVASIDPKAAVARIEFLQLAHGLPMRTPQDFRAAGAAEVLAGSAEAGIKLLLEAARGRKDVDAWSDLAAAYLTANEQHRRPLELVDALAAADHALAIDPGHAAAGFNRAVALQKLGLLQEAVVAWENALRSDAASPWADEALAELHALRFEVPSRSAQRDAIKALEGSAQTDALLEAEVRRHPRLARRVCETTYLGDWGEAVLRSDKATAQARLAFVRRIGNVLHKTTGENLLADAVGVIDDARDDPTRSRTLARASALYVAGRRAYSQQRVVDAEKKLRESDRLYAQSGSPLENLARYSTASTLYEQQRIGEAASMLDALAAKRLEERGYYALAAQIGWERGLANLVRGAFSAGRRILSDSRAEFAQIGETEAAATMDEFIAETDDFAGDAEGAWAARIHAFGALSRAGEVARKVTAIDAASAALIVRGEWERAAAVLNIATKSATELNDPLRAAHAFTDRSIALAKLGDVVRATSDLREARRWSSMLQDPSQRRAIEERGMLTEALTASDPRKSLAFLDRDISDVLQTERSIFALRLLLERARRHRELRNADAARDDVGLAMTMLESQRAAVTSVDGRALLAATAEELTMDAVAMAFERNTPADGFAALELWRGRAVLDALERVGDREGATAKPMTLYELSAALASRAAIVEYVLLPDRLITFVIRHDRAIFFQQRVKASGVRELVDAVSAAARNPEGSRDRSLADAYALFVAPISEALSGVDVAAFIPDPKLQLPFGSLFDATHRQSVGDRLATVIAANATLAIRCSTAARDRSGLSIAALAGDAFDRNAAPSLQTLELAAYESHSVARMYRHATLITGPAATKREIKRVAPSAEVIHFAGHANSTGARPADSVLFVAPDHDSGFLTAAEVSQWDLRRTRLVFLSACRTGRPGPTGDGIENLATAFVVAGAPTVIAATWDVSDQGAADTAIRFHRSFSTGAGVADSLRRASLNRNRPPWPPMTIFGGLSELIGEKGK